MTKTVLELDLVGYSTIAATLEQGLSVETSPKLNQQIQTFIDVGIQAAGVSRESTVMQTTGDGAILVFDRPSQAHVFADAVQQATRKHNATKVQGIGKRVFRIGIATGDLVMEPKANGGFDIAGMTIARAVRLEAKAKPGEVLCDPDTFRSLSAKQRKLYSAAETIVGKRDEKFEVRRCLLNPDGVKDAEFFTGEKSAPTPEPGTSKLNPAEQAGKAIGELREKAIACLKQSEDAAKILAEQLEKKTNRQLGTSDHGERCRQIITAMTTQVGLLDAVDSLVDGFKEAAKKTGGPSNPCAKTIREVCHKLLPTIYRQDDFRNVKTSVPVGGGALVCLPIAYRTSIEMIMAGVEDRGFMFPPVSTLSEFPTGTPAIQLPPEEGFDPEHERFEEAFRKYLLEKNFVSKERFPTSDKELEALIKSALARHLDRQKYRYYFVFDMPEDPTLRGRRQAVVEELLRKYPTLVFFGREQASDQSGEHNVLIALNEMFCEAAGAYLQP